MSAASGTIYYTVDGTQPSTSSLQYNSNSPPIVTTPTQINAVAYQSGTYSSVSTVYLDVDPALAPILQTGLILRLTSALGVVVAGPGSPAPVTEWIDLSGSGNSATANAFVTQPTFVIGNPGNAWINFNGVSQYFALPAGFSNFTGGGSFFLMVQPQSPSAGARFFDLGNGTASNNIFMSEPSTTGVDLHVYNGSTNSSVSSSTAIVLGQYQLVEGIYNGTSAATLYTNGAQDAQNTSMQTSINTTRSSNYLGKASGGNNFYTGNVAEILFYSNQLTTSQRTAVEGYLQQKYQLLSVVPRNPVISVPGGTLLVPTQVMISSDTGTATYITTDGTQPSNSSTPYCGGPINIASSQTLKAISYRSGVASGVTSATYTLSSTQFPAPSSSDVTAPTINLQLPTASH